MKLYIDNTDFNSITYTFVPEKKDVTFKTIRKTYKLDSHESYKVLEKLAAFLGKQKVSEIVVNKGPGSYTGTRIGVTHGLALSLAWQIPLKTLSKEMFLKRVSK